MAEGQKRRTAPRIPGDAVARMKSEIRRMRKPRASYSLGGAIDELRSAILEKLREGRTVDEIFDILAPELHCRHRTFETQLKRSFRKSLPEGTTAEKAAAEWADLVSGRPPIDTTASEIFVPAAVPDMPCIEVLPSGSAGDLFPEGVAAEALPALPAPLCAVLERPLRQASRPGTDRRRRRRMCSMPAFGAFTGKSLTWRRACAAWAARAETGAHAVPAPFRRPSPVRQKRSCACRNGAAQAACLQAGGDGNAAAEGVPGWLSGLFPPEDAAEC